MIKERQVEVVVTHSHADEVGTLYGCYYRPKVFRGIGRARIHFRPVVPTRTPEHWAAKRLLVLGGGGDVFDEHTSGTEARVAGMSAMKMMYQKLELKDSDLEKIVDEVTHYDNNIGCPKTHLGTLLKLNRITNPGKEAAGIEVAVQFINAIHYHMKHGAEPDHAEIPFLDYTRRFVMAPNTPGVDLDATSSTIQKLNEEGSKGYGSHLLSLTSMYRAASRAIRGKGQVWMTKSRLEEWMKHYVQLLYEDQVCYHTFRRLVQSADFEAAGRWVTIPVEKEGKTILVKVALVYDHSNNPLAHNVLRKCGALLSVVRNSTGNVTVLGNQKEAERLGILAELDAGLSVFAAMCRFSDLPSQKQREADWDELTSRGECPGDRYWYLASKNWLALFNGTHNHQSTATKLSLRELGAFLNHAFTKHGVRNWKNHMGIRESSVIVPFPRDRANINIKGYQTRPTNMADLEALWEQQTAAED